MDEKKNTVLIVDDEKSGIIELSRILSPEYTLYVSKNGENAIKIAETCFPDVILLDIIMPEMDGYEVISVLKNSIKTKDIPVIFVTGLDETEEEEKGFALGASDYITKPFSSAIVMFRVRNQIKLFKQQRITEYEIMKYKLANDALNIALWDMNVISGDPVNPDNKFTYSREFRLALGFYDEKEFPNVIHSWIDRLHPEDKQMTIDAFAAHINDHTGKTPFDVEYRLMAKTGEYRYFHALGTTMRDGLGVPLRTAGALMDITDTKRMEEEIAESNERLRLMLDSTPICCQLFNSDFKKIDCNQEAIRLFGFKNKQDFFERYHELYPEYQPDGQRTDEKVLSCLKKAVDEGSCSFNLMYRMLDGTPMPAEATIVRVEHGGDYFLAGYTRDLREYNKMMAEIHETSVKLRKTTEKALESEERLQVILDAIPISVHLINRDYEIFECNQESVDFVGAASKTDLLKRYGDIFPEFQPDGQRTPEFRRELLDKAFDAGWLRLEWMHQSLGNEPTPLPSELTLIRVKHKGEDIVAACSRDLREQKAYIEEMRRAEIAEESNEAKSRFLAMMSHEIRTPMNSIMGFAELALDNKEIDNAPQLIDYLVNIKDSTKWLLKIINDILDISKIESGKLELERVPFDLSDIFMRCQSVIYPEAKEKGLELKVYVEPMSGKRLLGDPLRLYQVLLNLMSNAVKFTDSGTVNFSSLVKKSEENNVTVYFEIRDSGIGMASEQIDKIFEPFMQAESNTTRNYGGTGLGLSITKIILELMGGHLSVESSPGMGSVFSFEITFDAIDASDDNVPGYAKLDVLEKPHFNGLILICDDNYMNQQVICEHLANVGFRTIVAENGKAGVEKVQERICKNERPFDLIFMDIFMPVMDGIEAAATIAALNTGTPIVALTANIMGSELEKYKKHGMQDCLGKPFTSQELWHVLLKYLVPESVTTVEKRHLAVREEKLLRHLKLNFIKSNQTTYDEIKKAADEGDIILAERIVHTLKGNAGQIGEQRLREAAAAAEDILSGQNLLTDEQMNILNAELKKVLEKLAPMLSEEETPTQAAVVDKEKIREIFEKLEPMLMDHNPECMNMLDEIRLIPGTDELARQIEDFEFQHATLTLEKLKKEILCGNE